MLSDYYDISQSTIHKVVNETYDGPKKETKKQLSKEKRKEIKEFYETQKYNKNELIEIYKISRRTINRILLEN